MKQTKTKLLCLLLAALMLLSLTACGKDKEDKNEDSDVIKLGDYTLVYKGACIMEDVDGNDALVLTLDFTNKSKEAAEYLWSVSESAKQDGEELETATVIFDYDTYESAVDSQMVEVEPGETVEVRTSFVLRDATSKVEVTFSEVFGKKNGTITIKPSKLERVSADNASDPDDGDITTGAPSKTGDELLDWWNGEWYGWWKMTG